MSWDVWVQIAQAVGSTVPLLTAAGGYAAGTANAIVKAVVPQLLTPAATAAGDALAERVKARLGAVATKAVELAGPDPKGILTDQTSMAVARAAAAIDDPDLQEMFARLLAAEVSGKQVHPSMVRILAEMIPDEARLFRQVAHDEVVLACATNHSQIFLLADESKNAAVRALKTAGLFIIAHDYNLVVGREIIDSWILRASFAGLELSDPPVTSKVILTREGEELARIVMPDVHKTQWSADGV